MHTMGIGFLKTVPPDGLDLSTEKRDLNLYGQSRLSG